MHFEFILATAPHMGQWLTTQVNAGKWLSPHAHKGGRVCLPHRLVPRTYSLDGYLHQPVHKQKQYYVVFRPNGEVFFVHPRLSEKHILIGRFTRQSATTNL